MRIATLKQKIMSFTIHKPANEFLTKVVNALGLVATLRLIADQIGYLKVIDALSTAAARDRDEYQKHAKLAKKKKSTQADNLAQQAMQLDMLSARLNIIVIDEGQQKKGATNG